jgi:uroporphyrinogen decarboxylase
MMSPAMLRRFCFEPIRKLINRAHELGLPVLYHTDGHVMNILPLIVEYGFDGINPLQASAGNDPEIFARDYADRLIVYGGLDNCVIIPNGTAAQVRAHVRHLFETLGRHGGLIASSHDIPFHVPMENLEAMVDEIKRCVY